MPVDVKCCAPHPHIGETLTVNYLRHNLLSGVVLVNYYLPAPPNTLEIDLVVINHNGVYLLEVKHWTGPIIAGPVHWLRPNKGLWDSPIVSIEHKARAMHGFLQRKGWGHVSAVGLVVLSLGLDAFDGSKDPNAFKVFDLHEPLIKALTGREYVFHRKGPLSQSEMTRLRRVIFDNHVADAERIVAGYRISSPQVRGHYVDMQAEDLEFPGHQVRIKQYDVPEVGSEGEIENAVHHFKRDMAALLEAGQHPNLLMPYKFHRDTNSDERYYLVIEWTGGQTLAERITAGSITLAEQFYILKNVAAALAHCHEQQVIHRNLTPYAIYLTDDGEVKVGDFDFAKMPAITRSLSTTQLMKIVGRHRSPELAFDVHDVDARADIYSLGAVWYDMLFRPTEDEPLNRGRITHTSLSESGRELLCSMLAEKRSERPASIVEVMNHLDRLSKDPH